MSVKTFIAAMSLKVKIIIACSAAFVISGAIAAGVILTKEDTYRVLKVFEMTGSSVITREGTGDIDAYIGMNLESGDTVTVGSGSTLRLALDSDKYLMLDSDTVLELIASGTAADSRTSINLKQGTILNEITTPLSANSSYEVSAPKATMAVRGTSFTVSVDKDNDGGYTIRENTLNGKVEVTLLDAEGNPTKKLVLVGADKGVTIRTEPDENSGNPAEKDGISRFVMEDENGNIFELGEGDDPIHEIFYNMLSAKVKENALRSNDEHLMELDELIVRKLRGELDESNTEEDSEDTAPAETSPVTEAVTEPETVPEQESAPAEATAPAETAVPETAIEAPQSVVTNAPVSAESQPETIPETVPETAPETSAETAPATSAETSASSVTTVPTEAKPDSTSAKTSAKTTANSSGTSVSTVTAPLNTGTLPPYTGTTPSYTGSSGTTAPTSESTAETSATEPEKTVYTVSFMYNGELYSTELVEEGSKIGNIPEPPTRTGYTGKWHLGDEEFTYDTPITSDITVNAVYTAKTYTVTFTANAETDNAFTKSFEAAYGETVIAPDVPAKTGYTGKWYIGDEEFTSAYVITSDITVTAKYTINTYTVTFIVDNKVLTSVKAEYNTSIKEYVPAVPEKEGYRDGKWCLETDAEFDPAMLITEDMTVTAVYTPMEFTVTYVPSYDESVVLFEETLSFGETPKAFTPETAVTESGTYKYYLWGWDKVKAELTAVTDNTTVIVPYVDYDDVHEIRVVNEGAVIYSGLYINGDTYVLPTPENIPEGSQFMGWGMVYSGGDFATGNKVGTPASEPGYAEVDTINLTAAGAEVTLNSPIGVLNNTEYRAIYEKLKFTLTIQYMSGTSEERTVQYGDKLDGYVSTDGTNAWTVNGTAVDISTYEIKSNITVIETSATDTLSLDDAFALDGYIPIADDTDTTITENEKTIPETPDTSSSDTSDSTPEQPVTEPQTEVIPDETGAETESSEPVTDPQTEDTTDDTIV
ncbi:MAG: InlB B-repeat-containing protein [Oscillospiraceae bacterium]|nr:InlB B-repeat-containing protein [Oscillospiraceae bacterium]MDD7279676.1 InlB B-repeat-containing protein [Oscillospiraceae bacterium]